MPAQTKIEFTREQLAEFAAFYEGDFTPLVGLLIRSGASRDEAQDVAQEAMQVTLTNWPGVQSPKAFVRTVALRTLRRSWRVTQRDISAGKRVAQDAMTAAFDANEDIEEAVRMLRMLPEAQRVAFALHHDGYGHAEIAEITGQHRDTVRSNLRHARQKLLRMLDPGSTRKEADHGP
ncbi:RNA polymerase sigma factor [Micromonospora echinofusca]|uniref:RNA polymerase sigma factor n=1 Tax=Micromonospora echinofusca TaxID=47858 RepID=UPI003421733F